MKKVGINGHTIVMLPESFVHLQEELQHHPILEMSCKDLKGFPETIGAIAAHCGVVMNAPYLPEDLGRLCDILVKRLRVLRAATITTH